MMDYSNNEKEKNTFIKGYKIKKNKIIVKLAGRRKNIIQNTNKNIEKLNQKMELQVKNAKMKKYNIFDKIAFKNLDISNMFVSFIVSGVGAIGFIFLLGHPYIIYKIVLGVVPLALSSIIYVSYIRTLLKSNRNYDLEKNKYFVENKNIINENIQKDETLVLGIDKNDSKRISKIMNNKQALDINSIDKLSLETLKTIRENITSKNVINDNKDSQIEYDAAKSKKLVR